MPFDIKKLTGTWKVVNISDNLPEIMKKLGNPPAVIASIKTEQAQVEVTLSGNKITVKATIMGKTSENTYTLGEESDEKGLTGTKQGKVTYTIEGDVLQSVHTNYDGAGGVSTLRRTFNGETLRADYEIGGLKGFYEAQKV